MEAEKQKVLETIKILDRPDDLCDEPLHPKLEEDCKNDQWEIKWFFNSDRSACKSFWYGGCEVESRNFFPDHAVSFLFSVEAYRICYRTAVTHVLTSTEHLPVFPQKSSSHLEI